jgi:hypothetical protein
MAQKILIDLMVFLWGLSGIPVIIRRELPYLIPIRGWNAVVTGIFMILGSWFIIIVANLPSK